jgi:hypothetical protein
LDVSGTITATGLVINGSSSFGNTIIYESTVSAPTATYVPINLTSSSSTLTAGNVYRVQLNTPGTGTNTGAVYIVYQTGATTWNANLVSANGTTSNNPLLRINVAGTGLEVYHNHGSTYSIHSVVNTQVTNNTTLTAPTYFGLEGAMTNLAGNVGIGTTSPQKKLHIVGNNATDFLFQVESTLANNDANFLLMPGQNSGAAVVSMRHGTSGGNGWNFGMNTSENFVITSRQSAANTDRLIILNNGNVGIGSAAPRGGLDVNNGAIIGKAATSNGTSTIDFSTGNMQYTSSSCGAFNLYNLKDGGTYMFAVQGGSNASACSFSAYSDNGATALTVHMPPSHGVGISSTHTLYNFAVMGSHLYVSWTPGY